jgi:hypothetical protein
MVLSTTTSCVQVTETEDALVICHDEKEPGMPWIVIEKRREKSLWEK